MANVDTANEPVDNEEYQDVLLEAYLPRGFGESNRTIDIDSTLYSENSRNSVNSDSSKLPHCVTLDEQLVESHHAVDVSNTQNTDNSMDKSGGRELPLTVTPEDQLDADDVEMDEDDITTKLLSIQVLPRIPKKQKPVTNNSTPTSVTEASSYCSVLERVNSDPSCLGVRYPNWSAAGWTRSNTDKPPNPKRWSRNISNTKGKKVETKPTKRTVSSEKYLDSVFKPKTDNISVSKAKRVSGHSAWSPNASDIAGGQSLLEIERISAEDEDSTVLTLTGPLPTLPFEEQMRERARLRKLKQHGTFDVANENSDTTDSVLKNCDDSKDVFDMADVSSFHTDTAEVSNSKPVVSHSLQDMKVRSLTNSTASVPHRDSIEHKTRRLPQHQLNENGHTRDHKPVKPHRRTSRSSAEDKANRSHSSSIRTTKTPKATTDEPMPQFKKEPASPPLPHLPVLPLFAAAVEGDFSSHSPENKTKGSRTKTAAVNKSTRKDSSAVSRLNPLRPKPPTSATFTTSLSPTKSAIFYSKTQSHEAGESKRKLKPPQVH